MIHQCLPSKSPLRLHPDCNERRRAANARWVETTCNSTRDCSVSVGLPQHPFMREHSRTRMSSAEAKPAQYTLETESTTLRTVRRRGWASPRSPPCKTTLFSFSSYGPCSAQPSVKQNIYGNIITAFPNLGAPFGALQQGHTRTTGFGGLYYDPRSWKIACLVLSHAGPRQPRSAVHFPGACTESLRASTFRHPDIAPYKGNPKPSLPVTWDHTPKPGLHAAVRLDRSQASYEKLQGFRQPPPC